MRDCMTKYDEDLKKYVLIKMDITMDDLIQTVGFLESEIKAIDVLRDSKSLPQGFGQHLRLLRRNAKMTQADISQRTGLAPTLVSQYETGRLWPKPSYILRFSKAIGFSIDEFEKLKAEYLRAKFGPENGTLGDILERERYFAKMEPRDIAAQIGITTYHYNRYERNKETPSWAVLNKIAMVLHSRRLRKYADEIDPWPTMR